MTAVPTVGSSVPAIDYANEPASIRHGDKAAKSAYAEGLGFAQVLVGQLAQQLTATISGSGDPLDSGDSSDGSGSGSGSGSGGSDDPAAGVYSSLLPQALTQGIMSGGGAGGLAMQLAEGIDPKLALGGGR